MRSLTTRSAAPPAVVHRALHGATHHAQGSRSFTPHGERPQHASDRFCARHRQRQRRGLLAASSSGRPDLGQGCGDDRRSGRSHAVPSRRAGSQRAGGANTHSVRLRAPGAASRWRDAAAALGRVPRLRSRRAGDDDDHNDALQVQPVLRAVRRLEIAPVTNDAPGPSRGRAKPSSTTPARSPASSIRPPAKSKKSSCT
jgi:hypothetical protein